jgi:hypothetical protein
MRTARVRREQHHEHDALEPDTRAVPEQLSELLEGCSCGICGEPISRHEMAAIWPAGDVVVHLACWAQSKGLVSSREAQS